MNRDFKGVWIPENIWFADLNCTERCFLAEIDSLNKNGRGCWAGNAHFAKFAQLSKNRCGEIIKGLEEKGFITIERDVLDGNPVRLLRLKDPFDISNPPSKYRQTPSKYRIPPSKSRIPPSKSRTPLYKDEIYNEKYIEKYKERDARALEFLKSNFPSRFEQEFLMRYSKGIKDLKKFVENFNDAVNVEQLDYVGSVLFARLGIYARNWIANQDKFSAQKNIDQKPNYLADGD